MSVLYDFFEALLNELWYLSAICLYQEEDVHGIPNGIVLPFFKYKIQR